MERFIYEVVSVAAAASDNSFVSFIFSVVIVLTDSKAARAAKSFCFGS